jgi:hypothetical protein
VKCLLLLMACLFASTAPAAHAGWVKTLDRPWTDWDAAHNSAKAWYPNCAPEMIDTAPLGDLYYDHVKNRQVFDVCRNDRWPVACFEGYIDWYKSHPLFCGHIARTVDTWCQSQVIRARDVYHGWERVTNVACEKWVWR